MSNNNKLYNILQWTSARNSSEEKIIREVNSMYERHMDFLNISPTDHNLGFILERNPNFGNKPSTRGSFSHDEPKNLARPFLENMQIIRVNLSAFYEGDTIADLMEVLFHECAHFMQRLQGRLHSTKSYYRNKTKTEAKGIKVVKGNWEGQPISYTPYYNLPWEVEARAIAAGHMQRIKNNNIISQEVLSFEIPITQVRKRKMKRIEYNPFI